MIAKTDAAGGPGLLPEVLAFSSSLEQDRALLREDLVGSLAHLAMLVPAGHRPRARRRALIHDGLVGSVARCRVGAFVPGGRGGRAHGGGGRADPPPGRGRRVPPHRAARGTTRWRSTCGSSSASGAPTCSNGLSALLDLLAARAEADRDVVLPAYTHRQRAQPVSAGYWWCAYGAMFARDVEAVRFVLSQVDASPLGVGAIAGTSLPTDRRIPQELLGFSRLTLNGLDTVGRPRLRARLRLRRQRACCCTPRGSRRTWSTSPPASSASWCWTTPSPAARA